ncbi:hypothetical protein GCM10028796_25890 [Ramlibacter monticola]
MWRETRHPTPARHFAEWRGVASTPDHDFRSLGGKWHEVDVSFPYILPLSRPVPRKDRIYGDRAAKGRRRILAKEKPFGPVSSGAVQKFTAPASTP